MATVDSLDIQIESSVQKASSSINLLIRKLGKLQSALNIDTSKLKNIGKSFGLTEVGKESQKIESQIADSAKSISNSIEKISKSMEQVLKDSEDIGKGFHVEGNLSAVQKAVEKYSNELGKAKLKKEELFAKGEVDTKKFRDAAVDVQKYSNIVESLKRQIESMEENEAQIEIDLSGIGESKRELNDFEAELTDFRQFMDTMGEVYGGISNVSKGMFDTPIKNLKMSLEELKGSFPEATNLISAFEKELKNIQEVSSGLTKEKMQMNVDTTSFEKAENTVREKIESLLDLFKDSGKSFYFEGNSEQLEKEIQKMSAELDKLFNREERMIELGKVDTDSFKALERDIQNTINKLEILNNSKPEAMNVTLKENAKNAKESADALEELREKMKQLKVPPINEENLEKLESMLKKTEEEIERLRVKLANGLTMGNIKESASDKNFQNLSAQISIAEKRADMLRQKIQDIGGDSGGKAKASLKNVSDVFKILGNAVQKAEKLISRSVKGIYSVVSSAFSKIWKIGARTASTIKNVASSIASSFSKIGSSSKSLKSASFNFKNLLKAFVGFKGIQGLADLGKNAIELGSNISEVENVVDTAFGRMAGHAYNFASSAKEQFGLSELAAKKYSGTMMAMLKSSGVALEPAAKMSTTIAGLAGDIASFYNIETDEAFYKLRSAISGETEPMKALGVNMNIVNLEAFAMSRGITKAYKDMTLAEQATLRYNYILAKTTDAQGDFAKTSGNFANQLRLLKLNFESISAVVGQGLIAAILPAIKWLNALMGKLMEAAKWFKNFMYTLMGKKVEGSQGGILNDMGGISDGLDSVGDAAQEAGDKLKKKLFTLPFDELNILSDESNSLKDSLGGIGDADIGGLDDLLSEDVEDPVNEWAKRIRDAFLAEDWEELGKTLAELVNKGLQKVYDAIIGITPKVEQALKSFAAVFNSFVEYLDWELLGRTIGAGINLITTSINALLGDEGIDFENLGAKLAAGFRGMVDEIDWVGLGNAIGNWFMVSWRIADGFISEMWRVSADTMRNGWEELGIAVGEAVNGVFDRINFEQISRVLTDGLRGIIESIASVLETIKFDVIAEKINAGLAALASGLSWESIGEQITRFAAAISKAFNDLLALDFGLVGEIIGNGITAIVVAFNQLTGENGINFELIGANIADGLRNLFASIPWEEFGNALGNGFMLGWRILDGFISGMAQQSGAGLTGWAELGISIGNAINGIFERIDFGAIGILLSDAFNGLIGIIRNVIETVDWDGIAANLTQGLNNFIHGVKWAEAGATLSDLVMKLLGVFWQVAQDTDWESLGRNIGEFLSNIDWGGIIGRVFDILWTVFSECISGLFDTKAGKVIIGITAGMAALKIAFKGVEAILAAKEFVENAKIVFNLLPDGIKNIAPKVVSKLMEIGSGLVDKVAPLIKVGVSKIAGEGGLFSKILTGASGLVSKIGPVLSSIGSVIFSPTGLLITGIAAGVILIIANWDKIKEAAGKVKDWVAEKWEGIKEKTSEIWGKVKDFLGETWDNIKGWASEKFENTKKAISESWSNIKETTQDVWGNIKSFLGDTWDGLKSWASEKFVKIKDNVGTAWDGLKQKTSDIWRNIKTFLGDTWDKLKSSASEKFNSIKDKLSDAWEDAKKKTSETWEKVKKTVGDKLSETSKDVSEKFSKLQSAMEGHGKNIISGLTSGIGSMASSLKSKIQEMAGNVENWFREKLGIHSPSTVFRGLAAYTMEGFADGIDSCRNSLKGTMSKVADDAAVPFFGMDRTFGDIGSKLITAFDTGISSQMQLISNQMKSMTNDMKDIMESVDCARIGRGMIQGLVTGVSSAMGMLKNVASSIAGAFSSAISGAISGAVANARSATSVVTGVRSVPAYATGGFPEDGLFFANHTELVGRFSNGQTAVANNTQIVEGIKSGVREAVVEVLAPYLADIAQNTRETADKEMSIRITDRDIVTSYNRGTTRQGYSFST